MIFFNNLSNIDNKYFEYEISGNNLYFDMNIYNYNNLQRIDLYSQIRKVYHLKEVKLKHEEVSALKVDMKYKPLDIQNRIACRLFSPK